MTGKQDSKTNNVFEVAVYSLSQIIDKNIGKNTLTHKGL